MLVGCVVLIAAVLTLGSAQLIAQPFSSIDAVTAAHSLDGSASDGSCPSDQLPGARNCHATVGCPLCAATEEFVAALDPAFQYLLPNTELLRATQTIEPQLQPPQGSRHS